MRLLIFLALAGIFFLAIDAVFTPWAFFMGGHFHAQSQVDRLGTDAFQYRGRLRDLHEHLAVFWPGPFFDSHYRQRRALHAAR